MYVQRTPAKIQTPKHRGNRPAASIIAQQRFSAIFVSLRFHSNKEKFGARCKNFPLLFLYV
jgi:hypothetical protein